MTVSFQRVTLESSSYYLSLLGPSTRMTRKGSIGFSISRASGSQYQVLG
ncbi:MAG: hypothetical protein ACR5LA_00410 [Wolbachia sp.]